VAGVGGGALYAPLQGVYADAKNVQLSYWVSWVGFMMSFFYGVGMVVWKRKQRIHEAEIERGSESGNRSYEVDTKEEKQPGEVGFKGAD
jgi:FHS family L-fucose permease-like MFS transporter